MRVLCNANPNCRTVPDWFHRSLDREHRIVHLRRRRDGGIGVEEVAAGFEVAGLGVPGGVEGLGFLGAVGQDFPGLRAGLARLHGEDVRAGELDLVFQRGVEGDRFPLAVRGGDDGGGLLDSARYSAKSFQGRVLVGRPATGRLEAV